MAQDKTTEEKIIEEKTHMDKEATKLAQEKALSLKSSVEYKKKIQEERNAAIMDEIAQIAAKGKYMKDGRECTLWDRLKEEADEATSPKQFAYHDWRSAMMSLLALCSALVDAGNQTLHETISPVTTPLKHSIKNYIWDTKDYILDKLRGDPRVVLPTLIHDVKINDDNKLELSLQRDDKEANMGGLNNSFRTLITLWLDQHGYEAHPEHEGVYVNKESREPLTSQQFRELKDASLHEFLGDLDLEFRAAPTP